MAIAKYMFIFSAILSFWLQSTFAFCIYNKLNGNSPVLEVRDTTDYSKSFKKTIPKGGRECCHYSNKDCNPTGRNLDPISLAVKFAFDGQTLEDQKKYLVICAAGGTIEFFGGSDDFHCVCSEPGKEPKRLMLPEILNIERVGAPT